jgi:Na+-transporting methylmalonyl-CoA/oxaloacetate decarboxylase gamma subunit
MTTLLAASASSSAAPGTLGFIVVFGLAVILVFVFRSMSKHIRKVNDAARRDEAAGSGAEASQADLREPAAQASKADDGPTIR